MLICNFDKPIGTIIFNENGTLVAYNCYDSNALFCWLEESDKKAILRGFFADNQHMKCCLGLSKGYTNLYDNVTSLCISKNYPQWLKIVSAFMKASESITVTTYSNDRA